jgi:hypothetical protein
MFDSIFDMILLKNNDGSEITALQTKKRNKNSSSDTLDWIKFIQACFMALIAVLICSFLACNIILVGLIDPEIIHPTIPCAPPYMPNPKSEKFEDAINIDRPAGAAEAKTTAYLKCASYDESTKTQNQLKQILDNVSPEVKAFYKEIKHKKQGEIYKVLTTLNKTTNGGFKYGLISQFAGSSILIVMRGCMIFRKMFHSFHTLLHSITKERSSRTIAFFVLMFLILSINSSATNNNNSMDSGANFISLFLNKVGLDYLILDTSNLFGLPIGINFFSMYNLGLSIISIIASSFVAAYASMIELENNPLKMALFLVPIVGFSVPLINLFIALDFMYYYLTMPLFNQKARGVITCMMANEFSKIIAFIYSIFVFNNARSYLDTLTSDIVFYVLLVLNLSSFYNYLKEDNSDEDIVRIGNCDMKQHLYKNIQIQNEINKE